MVVAKYTVLKPDGNGESLVAVKYRRVKFRWFTSKDVDSVFLTTGYHRWRPRGFDDGRDDHIIDEIVEADLKDTFDEDDVEAEHREDAFVVDATSMQTQSTRCYAT